MRRNAIKHALEEGRSAYGTFVYSPDPGICEVIGAAGFDFVVIDTEHASLDRRDVENLIRAADARGITALVRVTEQEQVSPSLDAGAGGIVIPHIGPDDRSRVLAASIRYQPQGTRGACTGSRAVDYGLADFASYVAEANRELWLLGQIEDASAVESVDTVLALPGLDAVLPGPSDLAADFGVPGQLEHPLVREALESIAAACARTGVTLAAYVTSAAAGREWRARGAGLIVCSIDYKVLAGAYAALARELRDA